MQASEASDEAKRILEEAGRRHVVLRLFGGIAVKYHSPSASHRSLQRNYPDLDFMGLGKQGKQVRQLFIDLGYTPNQRFNALHGRTRLMFEADNRTVDVFLDIFRMSHKLHIGKRLQLDPETIPLTDLLLTKLQIYETNEKDIRDSISILHDHEPVENPNPDDREAIDLGYIGRLVANDWGLGKTVTATLNKVLVFLPSYELAPAERMMVEQRAKKILEKVCSTPKTVRWKLRNLLGTRFRWYELPEAPVRTTS